MKLMNVTSIVYQLPFGKGRKFGANGNGVFDAVLGGWEINTINTAKPGCRSTSFTRPSAANDVTGRIPDYRGVAVQRPNLVGDPTGAAARRASTTISIRRVRHPAGQCALRQSRAERVPHAELLAVGSGRQQELPHSGARRHEAAVPVGVLQRPESHELRGAECRHHERGLRHDSQHLFAAADPVRVETAVLMGRRALLDCSRAAVVRISLVVERIMGPEL